MICKILGHNLTTKEQLTPDFYVSCCGGCGKNFLQYKWYTKVVMEWEPAMRDSFIKVSE
jgi:hypothetical protein